MTLCEGMNAGQHTNIKAGVSGCFRNRQQSQSMPPTAIIVNGSIAMCSPTSVRPNTGITIASQ